MVNEAEMPVVTTTGITGTVASAVAGNYAIACGKFTGTGTITLPSGWAHVTNSPFNGSTARQIFVAYKKIAPGDISGGSASYVFDDGSSSSKYLEMYQVSHLHLTTPGATGITTATTGSVNNNTLTTSGTLPQANCFVVAVCEQAAGNGGTTSVDSGFTLDTSSTLLSTLMAHKVTSATTALTPKFTWTTSRTSFGIQAVFLAAPDLPAAPVISTPTEAEELTTADFDITGTAESGSTVTLYDAADDTVIDTATATGGNWTISLTGQVDGSYAVYATATNTGAGEGTATADRNYTVAIPVVGGDPGEVGDPLVKSLNRIAGTTDLDAAGAANAYAGTDGLDVVGALNVAAENTDYRDLQGVLNQLAETDGLGVDGAAAAILA
jgi:hypothetical protein